MEHCERCGGLIDEAAREAGKCLRCGKRLPGQKHPPGPVPPGRPVSVAGPPAPLEEDQMKVQTDSDGAFYVYVGDRSYEFRQGAGCHEPDITRSMVRLVAGYLDRHESVVSVTTFFAMLGTALEERKYLEM
ncbi:MAG: hypothetical protein HC884_01755 [Chloroflexaceae bacterium]|nr:hypothetical protein [Chloroflexaceae bacterium]